MKIPNITALNNQWVSEMLKPYIEAEIDEIFEDHEWHMQLEGYWYEYIEKFDQDLYQKFVDLDENRPCLGSDLWYYEEQLGKPPGFEIYIFSIVRSFEIDEKYPDWNDPKKKHLGQYWTNPYEDYYHGDNNEQKKQEIIEELTIATKGTLKKIGLWEKWLENDNDITMTNLYLNKLSLEILKNVCLDTIEKPREIGQYLTEFNGDEFYISLP